MTVSHCFVGERKNPRSCRVARSTRSRGAEPLIRRFNSDQQLKQMWAGNPHLPHSGPLSKTPSAAVWKSFSHLDTINYKITNSEPNLSTGTCLRCRPPVIGDFRGWQVVTGLFGDVVDHTEHKEPRSLWRQLLKHRRRAEWTCLQEDMRPKSWEQVSEIRGQLWGQRSSVSRGSVRHCLSPSGLYRTWLRGR